MFQNKSLESGTERPTTHTQTNRDEQSSVELLDADEEERSVSGVSGYHDESSQFEMSAYVL